MTLPAIAIVGAGRVGLSLARALALSRSPVTVLSRGTRPLPDGVTASTDWSPTVANAGIVMLAVPDDVITSVARQLATLGSVSHRHVVLHCSGLHGRAALAPLASSGAALGSLHPLMTFTSADGEPSVLAGTPAVIEGDARAAAAARALAELLQMTPIVELAEEAKPGYHAGAVFAANYLVVLASIAERLAADAGADSSSKALYVPLMRRAVENVASNGAVGALTGPVMRGDIGTIALHLAALEGHDRELYATFARMALELARDAGLDAHAADAVAALLERH